MGLRASMGPCQSNRSSGSAGCTVILNSNARVLQVSEVNRNCTDKCTCHMSEAASRLRTDCNL